MKYLILVLTALLVACGDGGSSEPSNTTGTPTDAPVSNGKTFDFTVPDNIAMGGKGFIRPPKKDVIYNAEAVIPPQCYTKHDQKNNPCMTCHQTYAYGSRPNFMNDGGLQREYAFSDVGATNHWSNLFEDRTDRIAGISDQEAVDYINTDNYTPFIEQLESMDDWKGVIPKIENLALGAAAFDELGFAKDGSQWVAFNYAPLPSTFWPTNGSTDDVLVRLPEAFRNSCNNTYSRDAYIANLAIMEMAISDTTSTTTPPIDENAVCSDLNDDGVMGEVTSVNRPEYYVGGAADVPVAKMLYPLGVQFLHTVRYVGVTNDGDIVVPPRMKEVRYMKKTRFYNEAQLRSAYVNEQQEKIDELIPKYIYRGEEGTNNGFGWDVVGFIEAADGHLRLQDQEESLFCMGCHTTVGATIDQTFAFPRKVAGAEGWGYINLKKIKDVPSLGGTDGEILDYLRTVGGGNEFRENTEIRDRWFNSDGSVNAEKVKAANTIYDLITPSVERALALNKAYMTIVKDQDYFHGRDANLTAAENVYKEVDENTPTLPVEKYREWDIRLDWSK